MPYLCGGAQQNRRSRAHPSERLFGSARATLCSAPPPRSEDAQAEFEKFLANRKAGKSDADYWAARKAEEAPEEDDDDDFLKTIKYRPPE